MADKHNKSAEEMFQEYSAFVQANKHRKSDFETENDRIDGRHTYTNDTSKENDTRNKVTEPHDKRKTERSLQEADSNKYEKLGENLYKQKLTKDTACFDFL
eukprot:CAMPEP_0197534686 /NCGR_PEP_ID=MMETSP1318-20131121/48005_1 /TAXON_ID=552666 /ORGANISM="Partenskyella glossopodia, Strain RCC365" /LENGTH=100 /DNA_ID=CAMNT_0043092045 /DNA_START=8 /DNA_END=310 /DNA_ORIENTATION=+